MDPFWVDFESKMKIWHPEAILDTSMAKNQFEFIESWSDAVVNSRSNFSFRRLVTFGAILSLKFNIYFFDFHGY